MGCQPWGGPFSAALALPLGACVPYHSRFLTSLSLHFLACREGVDNDACIIALLRWTQAYTVFTIQPPSDDAGLQFLQGKWLNCGLYVRDFNLQILKMGSWLLPHIQEDIAVQPRGIEYTGNWNSRDPGTFCNFCNFPFVHSICALIGWAIRNSRGICSGLEDTLSESSCREGKWFWDTKFWDAHVPSRKWHGLENLHTYPTSHSPLDHEKGWNGAWLALHKLQAEKDNTCAGWRCFLPFSGFDGGWRRRCWLEPWMSLDPADVDGWLCFSLWLPANFLGVWEVTKHCRSGQGSSFESGFARYWQSDLVWASLCCSFLVYEMEISDKVTKLLEMRGLLRLLGGNAVLPTGHQILEVRSLRSGPTNLASLHRLSGCEVVFRRNTGHSRRVELCPSFWGTRSTSSIEDQSSYYLWNVENDQIP